VTPSSAGAKPVAGSSNGGRVGVPVVAEHQVVAVERDLPKTLAIRRNLAAVLRHDPNGLSDDLTDSVPRLRLGASLST
jgi:hypothetical protein